MSLPCSIENKFQILILVACSTESKIRLHYFDIPKLQLFINVSPSLK